MSHERLKYFVLCGLAMAGITAGATTAGAVDIAGGVHKSIIVRAITTPTTLSEGGFLTVPGTTSGTFIVPTGGDTFTVLFSGEAELRNASIGAASAFNNDDQLELQARFRNIDTGDIFNMNPSQATSVAGNNDREGFAMQWASRVPTGRFTFFIAYRVLDAAPLGVVSAELDDWSMTIQRYE